MEDSTGDAIADAELAEIVAKSILEKWPSLAAESHRSIERRSELFFSAWYELLINPNRSTAPLLFKDDFRLKQELDAFAERLAEASVFQKPVKEEVPARDPSLEPHRELLSTFGQSRESRAEIWNRMIRAINSGRPIDSLLLVQDHIDRLFSCFACWIVIQGRQRRTVIGLNDNQHKVLDALRPGTPLSKAELGDTPGINRRALHRDKEKKRKGDLDLLLGQGFIRENDDRKFELALPYDQIMKRVV